jgi:hypothetical protein
MDDLQIIALIEQEESTAYGINDTTLSQERADALDYYLGEPYGNELEGRSQVVTTEVQDTIEAALPQLLKIFVSGDEIVRFNPKHKEDIKAAEQETEYVNYIVLEKNAGYVIFYTWFKDALLSKNGYVKVYYEDYQEVENESYEGLTDAQIQMLVQDKNIAIVGHEQYPDPQTQQQLEQAMQQATNNPEAMAQLQAMPVPMLHNVKITVTESKGKICIKNIAPENIMVSVDTPNSNLQDSRFVQHREFMTKPEIEKLGFDVPDNVGHENQYDQESMARDIYDEQYTESFAGLILIKDTYLMVEGKRMRYVVVGNTILHQEEVEIVPICSLTPHLMPHRHIGRSYADLTMSDQLVGSTLKRGLLDAMYLANAPRFAISDKVNLDDMLVSRPGGVVRTTGDPSGNILPLLSNPPSVTTFSLIELLDSQREKRTGVTSYNQGLDSDSLNKTKGGMQMIMNAAQERLTNVARLFAETGVKDLFIMVHRLVRTNYTKPDIVRLRNEWVEVDPRQWKNRNDMSIAVGLGTGNKDQQLQHLMTMLEVQERALQIGVATPKNIYHATIKLAQNAGFKDAEEFFTDPANQQQQEPPPDPKMIEVQMKAEQSKQQLEFDKQKAMADYQSEQAKMQMEYKLKEQQMQMEMQLKREEMMKEIQIQREKVYAEVNIERERMGLEAMGMEMDAQQAIDGGISTEPKASKPDGIAELKELIADLAAKINKPKTVKRDKNNRIIGVE